jgi:hypothetical protein
MDKKDKEAFLNWCYSDAGDTMLSTGEPEWVWYAACEYKNKQYSDICDVRMQTSLNNVKLQAENAKLRKCVEFYADLDDEAIWYDIRGVTYARQVLKELEGENE